MNNEAYEKIFRILEENFLEIYESRKLELDIDSSEIEKMLQEKYNLETSSQVTNLLLKKIKDLSCFDAIDKNEHDAKMKRQNVEWFRSSDLKMIYKQFYIKSALGNFNANTAKILENLWCHLGNALYFELETNKLKSIFNLAIDLYLIVGDKFIYQKEFEVVGAIKHFNLIEDQDFKYNFKGISIEEKTNMQIHRTIENDIKQLGGFKTLKLLFEKYISNKYDKEFDRYFLFREKDSLKSKRNIMPIPLQYIIHIAAKHLSFPSKKITHFQEQHLFNKIIKDGQKYVSLLEIYDSSPYGDMLLDYEGIAFSLKENIIYETLCIPQQYSPDFIKMTIKNMYLPILKNISNYPKFYDSKSILNLIEKILNYPPCSIFTQKEISQKLRLSSKFVYEFLEHFSQDKDNVNKNFDAILQETTLYSKPLIKLSDGDYFLLSSHFCGYAFCEQIYNTMNDNYIGAMGLNRELGLNFENLIKKMLSKKKIPFKFGTYSPKVQDKEGECDLVLENNKSALFVEMKNCGLPKEFEKADDVTVLNFLSMGMLPAQKQILHHKVHLKCENEMKLYKDKNDIEYSFVLNKPDKIFSISLCATEYAFFTAGMLTKRLTEGLCFLEFSSSDTSRQKELKRLNKLSKDLNQLIEKYAKLSRTEITINDIFYGITFKSSQQLWIALKYSNSIGEFIDNLTFDTYCQYSIIDYYAELKYHLKLRDSK